MSRPTTSGRWALELGRRICAARKQAGLSQRALARHVESSQGAVSQWERGLTEPSVRHFIQLVHLLGLSLLGSPEDRFPAQSNVMPSAEILEELVRSGLTDSQIAERVGVTPRQVIAWRKLHNIRRPVGRPVVKRSRASARQLPKNS